MTRSRLLAVGMVLAVIGCGGEPTEPRDNEELPTATTQRIEIGDTVLASFASSDTSAYYTIQPSETVDLALFFQAEQGHFSIFITDSITGEFISATSVLEDRAPDHLSFNRSDIFRALSGRVLLVQVLHSAGSPGQLRTWVYQVNRAPEILPGTITVGDTLQGEILENLADIDEFTFAAEAGQELIAYIQGEQGTVPAGLALQVVAPSGETIAGAVNNAGDTELEAQPTPVFLTPANGTYRLYVRHIARTASADYPGTGKFKVLIRRINRAPENSAAVLAPGDTLGSEIIDFVGDIDEFQVPVTRDSFYNVFLQTSPAANPVQLNALVDIGTEGPLGVTSTAGDSALAGQFSRNFRATQTGTVTIQISGSTLGPPGGLHRGGYRLFVYPVDRSPELVPRAIAAGDSVSETIEYPGDIDHFTVSPSSTGAINLVLYRTLERSDWLDLWYTIGGERHLVNCYKAGCGAGKLLTSSPLPVEIASQLESTTGFRGAYRLVTLPLDFTPEGRSEQLVIGQQVTEQISPLGDADIYELTYSAGDILEFEATGGTASSLDGFTIVFTNPAGIFMGGYAAMVPTSPVRFTLPSSGTYRLTASGSGQEVTSVGPYSFTIRRFPTAAEFVTNPIAIGDSVIAETIGQLGDVDDFVIAGPAGAEVQAFLRGPTRLLVDATVADASTPVRAGTWLTTGRLTLPASGRLGLRVYEPRTHGGALSESNLGFTGPYSLVVHPINRSPESVSPSVTLGTTKDGEAIELQGDIDEFSFSGTAGQTVSATIQAPFAFDGAYVQLAIVDPATGAVLGTAQTWDATVAATGPITLPGTRSYTVRVAPVDDTRGKGGYRFTVQ